MKAHGWVIYNYAPIYWGKYNSAPWHTADRQNLTDDEAVGFECGDILRAMGSLAQLNHHETWLPGD